MTGKRTAWLRRKWAWARENPFFWFNLLLIVISVLVLFVWHAPVLPAGPSDLSVRMLGLALQLVGVITVWRDLTRTARQFGKAGFLSRTWEWLKRGLMGGTVSVGAAFTMTGGDSLFARGRSRQPIQPSLPLADRVTTLEMYVGQIDQELTWTHTEIDRRARELDTKIDADRAKHDAAIREVKASIEEAATGSLAALVFGVVWLAIGIGLATLAPEIAKLKAGEWYDVWSALW